MPNLPAGGLRWLAGVFVLLLSATTVGATSAGGDPVYGANPVNMWGPPSDPEWAANDPTLHADSLRGTALCISAGTGMPGPHESMSDRDVAGNPVALADHVVIGGGFESVVNGCTARLAAALGAAGVPARIDFRPTGTHAWGYRQDALHDSWPMFAAAIGA